MGIKLPLKGAQPRFPAQFCCGQMAGGIKMPLDAEVGLGPGDIVLDGDPAPPTERGTATSPTFRPMSIVFKRSPISATAELFFGIPATVLPLHAP